LTAVQLGLGAFDRTFAQGPKIELLNRFVEASPTNQQEMISLLARPGNDFLRSAGNGPIRLLTHQPGAFNDDLFFVSDETLFRYDGVADPIAITGTIVSPGSPQATFTTGAGFEHLFISDGATLQLYDGEAAATGTLTVSGGSIVATDTVEIDSVFYEWTAGSVDAGTPMGTMGDPFLVALGASDADAIANLGKAIRDDGVAGTDYSTAVSAHTTVTTDPPTATSILIRAKVRGVGGNSITTTETGANIAWSAGTLEGGGAQALRGVPTPDGAAPLSLATLASFVLVALANTQRFFWIFPGEVTIDPLNFAEAENEPDNIIQMLRVGDTVYMFGQSSTEVWVATGDGVDPFMVAEDNIAYSVVGRVRRVSNNGIEEKIRKAAAALV